MGRGTSGDRDRAVRRGARAHRPTQFLVLPGHETPEIEFVVTLTPIYLLVQKTGEAAEVVIDHLDDDWPRAQPGRR